MTAADPAEQRTRLLELRADALRQLVAASPIVDCGLLRLIADCTVVLTVLEDAALSPEPRR